MTRLTPKERLVRQARGQDVDEIPTIDGWIGVAHGEAPLFFAGLSVSRTLPFGTPDDVREEVDYFLDFTDGGRGLFLMTSNVTGVEVPPENIHTAYRYIKEWNPRQPRQLTRRQWPWAVSHPEDMSCR